MSSEIDFDTDRQFKARAPTLIGLSMMCFWNTNDDVNTFWHVAGSRKAYLWGSIVNNFSVIDESRCCCHASSDREWKGFSS